MGIFKKDEMLLDFKGGMRTEDISSTIPYLNKLNTDAKMLVNRLGPNMNEINKKRLVLINENEKLDLYKLFEKSTTLNNNDNNFSETSPFISSDVYNQLLNKNISNQLGGARNEDHDDDIENESSTSSSSSSSSSSSISESDSEKKNRKNIIKKFKKNSDTNYFSGMSAGSYLSSSAHTDGSDNSANSEDSENSESYKSNSFTSSTVSIRNHKSRNHNYSDSVDTSDINILSLDN